MKIERADAVDYLQALEQRPTLVATDPPYAFGGSGAEHALTAKVPIALRLAAERLEPDGWLIVFCASSWRSVSFMVESLHGVAEPVRHATWCKPLARTAARSGGWKFATVPVLLFRKGKPAASCSEWLDHILEPPVQGGRRAQLPERVADWAVGPFATRGGICLDPFAGSGALLAAAERHGMRGIGCDLEPG